MKANASPDLTADLPPFNEQAEWSLIACAMESRDVCADLDVNLFYIQECRDIFSCLATFKDITDPVIREFRLGQELGLNRLEMALQAHGNLPSLSGYHYWLQICQEYAQERTRLSLLQQMRNEKDPVILQAMSKRLGELCLTARVDETPLINSHMPGFVDRLEESFQNGGKITGLSTGFPNLDDHLNGLEHHRFYVIGARPGIGKSAFLLQTAIHIAKSHPVLFFSLEMPIDELIGRAVQMESGVSTSHVRKGRADTDEFKRFSYATASVNKLALRIDDRSRSLTDIVSVTSKSIKAGVKAVFVDYLQLVNLGDNTNNMNRCEMVTRVSVAMKDMAMRHGIAVISAAQLNRGSEKENRKPTMSDLRDSGAIEQDSDVVMLLHRSRSDQGILDTNTILDINKARGCRCGFIDFTFTPHLTKFSEVSRF